MTRRAFFPASFDPLTNGHHDLILRSLSFCDELFLGIGKNPAKKSLLPLQKRLDILEEIYGENKRIKILPFDGLMLDAVKSVKAQVIVRGLRTESDFLYEAQMSWANFKLDPQFETVFLMTRPEFAYISSSLVKEILELGKSVGNLVPRGVEKYLNS